MDKSLVIQQLQTNRKTDDWHGWKVGFDHQPSFVGPMVASAFTASHGIYGCRAGRKVRIPFNEDRRTRLL
jgi:hypothetical protein